MKPGMVQYLLPLGQPLIDRVGAFPRRKERRQILNVGAPCAASNSSCAAAAAAWCAACRACLLIALISHGPTR